MQVRSLASWMRARRPLGLWILVHLQNIPVSAQAPTEEADENVGRVMRHWSGVKQNELSLAGRFANQGSIYQTSLEKHPIKIEDGRGGRIPSHI